MAILEPDGELVVGACDAGPIEDLDAGSIGDWASILTRATWVFADCNLNPDALAALIALRARSSFKLAIDAVSAAKVLRLPSDLRDVDALFLNVHQVGRLPQQARADPTNGADGATEDRGATHLAVIAAAPVDVMQGGRALVADAAASARGRRCSTRCVAALVALTRIARQLRPDLSPHPLASRRL